MMSGYERARGGRGQSFSFLAEVGVGKVILVYEFSNVLAFENFAIPEGRCLFFCNRRIFTTCVGKVSEGKVMLI